MALIDDLLDLAERPAADLPADALRMAELSLMDWTVCGLAAVGEPLSDTMHAFARDEGGRPVASLFGGGRAPARMAALVNGTISHIFDFDDTHFGHIGHLSVGIFPAALALGEETGASAAEVVAAFLVGAESAVRVGVTLGAAHYNRGFHQTATAGAFGATVAAGRLIGLTRAQLRSALGLCASRAAGVKALMGTNGKPINAGAAAANGVEAARFAALGVTAMADGLEGPQAFLATHTDAPGTAPSMDRFHFEDNTYKFHACCHGLHAMIEALSARPAGIGAEDVAALHIRTNPRWLKVCNNASPRTALEVKFSYAYVSAMVMHGRTTAEERAFTDALASDPALAAFARRVTVEGDDTLADAQTVLTLTHRDGRQTRLTHDLMDRPALGELAGRLAAKARAMLGDTGAEVAARLATPARLSAADLGAILREAAPRSALTEPAATLKA